MLSKHRKKKQPKPNKKHINSRNAKKPRAQEEVGACRGPRQRERKERSLSSPPSLEVSGAAAPPLRLTLLPRARAQLATPGQEAAKPL